VIRAAAAALLVMLGPVEQPDANRALAVARLAHAERRPLILVLDGPGGNVGVGVHLMLDLFELRLKGLVVHCEVRLYAASMSAYLFESLACTDRAIGAGAALVFHKPQADGPIAPEKLVAIERLLCQWLELASRGTVTGDTCVAKLDADPDGQWPMLGTDAVYLDLADRLLP